MDISVEINNVKLNLRVSILLETAKGFVFENTGGGFYFPVGGRIKINETSVEATKREVKEELDISIDKIDYIATLENFFMEDKQNIPYHEINIIYYAKIDELKCPKGFYIFNDETIKNVIIKPEAVKKMIMEKNFNKKHLIEKDY